MATTLVPTVGSASANAYVSVAEADTYFTDRGSASAWTGTDDVKARALIQATDRIDQEEFRGYPALPLNGTRASDTQALKWPRQNATDDEGWTYEDDVIPERIKKATMELALEILAGNFVLLDTGLEAYAELGVGPIKLVPKGTRETGALPAHVRRFLEPLLDGLGAVNFRIERA